MSFMALLGSGPPAVRLDRNFNGRVSGHVHAQPLFWDPSQGKRKLLIVATEDDVVAALDADSGKVVWEGQFSDRRSLAATSHRSGSPGRL
jgi:hypothetical protein